MDAIASQGRFLPMVSSVKTLLTWHPPGVRALRAVFFAVPIHYSFSCQCSIVSHLPADKIKPQVFFQRDFIS